MRTKTTTRIVRATTVTAVAIASFLAGPTALAVAANPIATENALPGTTAWEPHFQGLANADQHALEGYASEVSVQPGDTVHLHVSTNPVARYRVEVYRLGWYGGTGGRLVGCTPSCTGDKQGTAYSIPALDSNGFVDPAWPVTDTFTIPANAVSGYYLAKLRLTSGSLQGGTHNIPVIVREPAGQNAPALVIAPVNTWQAYNPWGGKSLYDFQSGGVAAVKVSFNRPYQPAHTFLEYDLDLIRWLEREGYDVSYTTDVDVDSQPGSLLQHTLVMTAGHDEYWSKATRDGLEAARDAGVNLAFMGANTGYWQVRHESAGRTLVEYRDAVKDPHPDPTQKTIRFRDLATPRPECELLGVQYMDGIEGDTDPPRNYTVVSATLSDPWFAGSGFVAGSSVGGVVGYEWDRIVAGCGPSSLTTFFHYSGTPSASDATRYTASSGARVFATGSLGFVQGLDNYTNGNTDARLQQFMRNAMVDLLTPSGPPPPPAVPVNSVLPVISGTAQVGQSLASSTGTWSGSPSSYAYQWSRCNNTGGSCVDIGGAASPSYLLVAADLGSTLRVRVTASNATGPGTPVTSGQSGVVAAAPAVPVNSVLPVISGTAQVGLSLSSSTGTWSGSPTSYAYQWSRCNSSGASCVDIGSATNPSYLLVAADLGSTLRVRVVASNATGPGVGVTSVQSGVVVAQPPGVPVNSVLPAISGTAQVGQTLSSSTGTWSGSPTSYAYQWSRCNSGGASCIDIGSATSPSYLLVAADQGATLRVRVVASNASGPGVGVTSVQSGVVVGLPVAGAFPSGGVVDAFGRADASPLSGLWSGPVKSTQGPLRLIGGQAASGLASYNSGWYTGSQFGPDMDVFVTVTGLPATGQQISLLARVQNPGSATLMRSYNFVYKVGSGFEYWRGTAGGTYAQLGATIASPALAVGDGLGFRVQGSTLTGYYRKAGVWTALASRTDTVISGAGYAGLELNGANSNGRADDYGAATIGTQPPAAAPTNSVPPTITGTAQVGQTLSSSTGTWSGSPTSYAYQWSRCNSSGASCVDIGSATNPSYLLVAADQGTTLRVRVTASNATGPGIAATSSQSGIVVAQPPAVPVNSVLPAISGTTQVGQTLSSSTGTWSGSPTSYAYQWSRCNSSGASCVDIGSATNPSYLLVAADQGTTLRVRVTATNATGPGIAATSSQSGIVAAPPAAPTNSALPTITGTAQVGSSLTSSTGTWSGSPTSYAYQWSRCDSAGASCVDIGGATNPSYLLVAADQGTTLRVRVTASNATGPGIAATSSQSGIVAAAPAAPTNSVPPTITGTAQVGQTLSSSTGTWSGSPTSYAYQWSRCDNTGASCVDIGSASNPSYLLVAADQGATLRVRVTATNATGPGVAVTSDQSAVVAAQPPAVPVNSVLPAITGTTQVGQTLSSSTGTWSGSPTSYAYQWSRCNSAGASCVDIGSATNPSYLLVAADQGATLRVRVTASNATGPGTPATSSQSGIVAAAPAAPVNSVLPTITGTTQVGSSLSSSTGTWSGSPTSYAYQWSRCNSAGASCIDIGGASSPSYLLIGADQGATLRVRVTASNAIGPGTPATSNQSAVISAAAAVPVNSVLPAITGTAQVGSSLSSSTGTWSGSPTSYAYQWSRCNNTGASCIDIGGASNPSYLLVAADQGATLRVRVTATNATGPGSPATSNQSAVISAAPALTNLAPNPGFELTPTTSFFTHGDGTFTWATDQSNSATHSLKIVSTTSTLSRWLTNTTAITAQAGKTYTASVYAKTNTVTGSVRLTITYWNASATYLGVAVDTPTLTGTQNWTKLTISQQAPTGTAYIRLEMRLTGPGTAWYDDLTLTTP